MVQRLADFGEDAAVKAGLSVLFLCVAPVLWVLQGLLLALFGPAHGVFEWIEKIRDVWMESNEVQEGVQAGTFFGELGSAYTVAFYFGMIVLLLLVAVSALCLISTLLKGKWAASAMEGTAAAIWLILYWTYRVVASVMLIVANLAMLGGFCMAVIQMFRTAGFVSAVFGSLFAFGLLMVTLGAVNVSFLLTLSPLYVCLRYVVPLGFICGEADGIAGRRLKSAFADGNHFPFWLGA